MRRSTKVLLIVGAFLVCYLPLSWVWEKALPTYSGFVCVASESLVNTIELTSGIRHGLEITNEDFVIKSDLVTRMPGRGRVRLSQDGNRPYSLVSYNLTLWAGILISTCAFIDRKAILRYFVIGLVVLVAAHLFDLTIFVKNTRSILLSAVTRQYEIDVNYSYVWHRIWWWSLELNRRIIAPSLPLLLWIVLCWRSFYIRNDQASVKPAAQVKNCVSTSNK